MKRLLNLLVACVIVLSFAVTVYGAEGRVTYSGNAGEFVFKPGSDNSLTDLFPDFKGVMPGDTLTQKITVKNDADNNVKVKIYIRSLGAHEDSEEFLSQLGLKVQKSDDNEMAYMFDATADETAQLTDWVCLGMLYSGGEVNLDVILEVPVELDNRFQSTVGYLDWEFMIEEFPVEAEDPYPPQTGDVSNTGVWVTMIISALLMLFILLVWRKKDRENEENAVSH